MIFRFGAIRVLGSYLTALDYFIIGPGQGSRWKIHHVSQLLQPFTKEIVSPLTRESGTS